MFPHRLLVVHGDRRYGEITLTEINLASGEKEGA